MSRGDVWNHWGMLRCNPLLPKPILQVPNSGEDFGVVHSKNAATFKGLFPIKIEVAEEDGDVKAGPQGPQDILELALERDIESPVILQGMEIDAAFLLIPLDYSVPSMTSAQTLKRKLPEEPPTNFIDPANLKTIDPPLKNFHLLQAPADHSNQIPQSNVSVRTKLVLEALRKLLPPPNIYGLSKY
ncbi:hypothetical protein SERLADRAFT_408976 [Serpula lacrymans var. lacrymans S7.9]|uniref:Uncharacterized protein n=1 Tax=Serpula lacrymans var. lacrymans (strain S7.9) TaxID=578457 RepID=F8NYK2_SERL9|nr:uncharacterized protein SERLADRAFT_408976 [Serpula lacrymans var. lacrymans S7.9]EGO23673.1 hypothetical protein SERLADRAFT_408976 [Serpula lacrymans var. lacrymans S7.9]